MQPDPSAGGWSESMAADLGGRLRSAVRRACPEWLQSQSEDIVQSVLLKLMEISRRREGNPAFSSLYLEKAAYCALVDEIRRRRRNREVPAAGSLDERPAIGGEGDPERRAVSARLGEAIRGCLGRMLPPRQAAVTLHLQGRGVRESAELLGWSMKRVENLVYRGLEDLRGCLRARGMTP